MIIFLNGTSSSGKSTLARAIMRQSDQPFIYYSIDHLVNFWMDEKFVAFGQEPKEWFYHESIIDDSGNLLTQILDGPRAIQLHWDMIDSLAVLIEKGYDLIIDELLWNADIFRRYIPALSIASKVYLVKVNCNLITCEEREKVREDRYRGLARSLYSAIETYYPYYDIEADTTYLQPEEIAQSIIQYIDVHPKPKAFLQIMRSEITFDPLTADHFPLLHQWLNNPMVVKSWNENKEWTRKEIADKYLSYVEGFKPVGGEKKPIHPFIVSCAGFPIGYIQFYNAYDFPREGYTLQHFPSSLAAIDVFIGEPHYIGKGLAATIIQQLLSKHVWKHYSACLLDPDNHNAQAIRAYEKAGFRIESILKDPPVTLMLQNNPQQKLTQSSGAKS